LVLVGREARLREHVGRELPLLGVRDAGDEPAIEVVEHLHELGDGGVGVHRSQLAPAHGRRKAVPINSASASYSTGFVRWWSNPAALVRRRSSSWPTHVRATD